MDTHYIDGMPSITGDGSQGIRPLTDEEKDWLDNFYRQDLIASWKPDESGLIEGSEEFVAKIEKSLKKAKNSLKAAVKKKDVELVRELNATIDELNEEYRKLNRKIDSYRRNNERNRCLHNQSKKTGKLVYVDYRSLDEDDATRLNGLELEHLIVDDVDIDENEFIKLHNEED